MLLTNRKSGQYWVEPFVGGGNLIHLVDGPRIGCDIHPQLIALLTAVRDGWFPPTDLSEAYEMSEICNENKVNKESSPTQPA